jgi:hypothetical protein
MAVQYYGIWWEGKSVQINVDIDINIDIDIDYVAPLGFLPLQVEEGLKEASSWSRWRYWAVKIASVGSWAGLELVR